MNDAQITALFEARDEQAVSETMKKYGAMCLRVAAAMLPAEDAEECVNDAMMKLWNAIPPAKPEIFEAFVVTLVRRTALNRFEMLRTEKRGGGQISEALDEIKDTLKAPDDTESQTDAKLLTEHINAFLRTLKTKARRVFLQRYWYMMSVAEIAHEQHMSESAVKISLMRTRNKLHDFLEKEGLL